ncbi:CoA pyrophosphatase [Betaproteobacteria bacterium GR16-43]|nr:CoA pyrophosphatase [Betaproteobacteria bacterium GR16-43]
MVMVAASYTWPVDRDDIRARLADLPPLEDLLTADDLEKQREAGRAVLRPAAVLLLIVNRAEGPTVVFTQRTAHLPAHAGQISFPGGRREEGDPDAESTALRESHEEVGLDPTRVEVLGRLPAYMTSTGFNVIPIVGWAEPPLADWRPDPDEVADVFEVPLAFLLDAGNHKHESAFYKGRMRHYWAMPFGSRFIWGATAGMLVTFQRIVAGAR